MQLITAGLERKKAIFHVQWTHLTDEGADGEQHPVHQLKLLFFGDPGLFLAVPFAVMYTAAIAIKYVQVMYSHLRKITEITRLL